MTLTYSVLPGPKYARNQPESLSAVKNSLSRLFPWRMHVCSSKQRGPWPVRPVHTGYKKAASMHFVKVRGARDSPKGRTVCLRLQRDAGQVGEKKNGRNLSLWRERGTRDLSLRELALSQALRSSAQLFFPHRSLGGRKREDARGKVTL